MFNKINFLFVSLFGIGKIKKIPGTLGSLFTTLFLFFLFHIMNVSANIILFSIIIIFIISFYAVNIYIKNLSNKDPKEIVIDEVITSHAIAFSFPIKPNFSVVFPLMLI